MFTKKIFQTSGRFVQTPGKRNFFKPADYPPVLARVDKKSWLTALHLDTDKQNHLSEKSLRLSVKHRLSKQISAEEELRHFVHNSGYIGVSISTSQIVYDLVAHFLLVFLRNCTQKPPQNTSSPHLNKIEQKFHAFFLPAERINGVTALIHLFSGLRFNHTRPRRKATLFLGSALNTD